MTRTRRGFQMQHIPVGYVQSEILMLQVLQGFCEQPRARQQHQRERRLKDNHPFLRQRRAVSHRPGLAAQGFGWIGVGRNPGRHDPNTMPVASDSRNANPSTASEGVAWMALCTASGNASARIARVPA